MVVDCEAVVDVYVVAAPGAVVEVQREGGCGGDLGEWGGGTIEVGVGVVYGMGYTAEWTRGSRTANRISIKWLL